MRGPGCVSTQPAQLVPLSNQTSIVSSRFSSLGASAAQAPGRSSSIGTCQKASVPFASTTRRHVLDGLLRHQLLACKQQASFTLIQERALTVSTVPSGADAMQSCVQRVAATAKHCTPCMDQAGLMQSQTKHTVY